MANVNLKLDGLNKLLKAMKVKPPKISIGLEDPEQATIGAMHEFGTSTLPVRSFLRVPLRENMSKVLARSGFFTKKHIARAVKEGTLNVYAEKIGDLGKEVVIHAFDSGGYGKWKPTIEPTGHPILIDTGELRASIVVKIEES